MVAIFKGLQTSRLHRGYGVYRIWSCPVRTNDMNCASYHGYALTDHYQVDPRFGTLEDFKTLVEKADERGIKFSMDQIVNHCGLFHWWMDDYLQTG